jgi:adenosylcobinamide amidohydrolase
MEILSTLAGQRQSVSLIANHFFPPPSWGLGHNQGLAGLEDYTLQALGLDKSQSAFLFTGADMENLSVVNKTYKDISVYALITAGVRSNALRMASDEGLFYPDHNFIKNAPLEETEKPGTINILLLTNVTLSPRAMTKAIINITEAKSAALQDLDVRSTPSPSKNQATGTGTDNIIVVQGAGPIVERTGGHTKIGQLIAEAVYEGILQSAQLQDGLTPLRPIFHRLKERHVNLYNLIPSAQLRKELEELLLEKKYADFVAMAFEISDRYEKKLIRDNSSFRQWCLTMASDIAGKQVAELQPLVAKNLPPVIHDSLSALISGLHQRRLGQ